MLSLNQTTRILVLKCLFVDGFTVGESYTLLKTEASQKLFVIAMCSVKPLFKALFFYHFLYIKNYNKYSKSYLFSKTLTQHRT